MVLLLTIVSVLAVWLLLIVLVFALLMILKPLEGARRYLGHIAMGVRAIETQTAPLRTHAEVVGSSLRETSTAVGQAADGVVTLEANLSAAEAGLQRLLGMVRG